MPTTLAEAVRLRTRPSWPVEKAARFWPLPGGSASDEVKDAAWLAARIEGDAASRHLPVVAAPAADRQHIRVRFDGLGAVEHTPADQELLRVIVIGAAGEHVAPFIWFDAWGAVVHVDLVEGVDPHDVPDALGDTVSSRIAEALDAADEYRRAGRPWPERRTFEQRSRSKPTR